MVDVDVGKKYRFFWKANTKPCGFVQGGIYVVDEIGDYRIRFKGYNVWILLSDFKRIEASPVPLGR